MANTWKFSPGQLLDTPSIKAGMKPSNEAWTRVKACIFATRCGESLGLLPENINIAKLFVHRFYMRQDFARINYHDVVPSALFITTKLQDNYRRLKDIVRVCAQKSKKDDTFVIQESDKEFQIWSKNILFYEELLLETLCFDLEFVIPHPTCLLYLKDVEGSKIIGGAAYKYCSDWYLFFRSALIASMNTTLILQYSPRTLAAASIHAATLSHPDEPMKDGWIIKLGCDPKLTLDLAKRIMSVSDEKTFKAIYESRYIAKKKNSSSVSEKDIPDKRLERSRSSYAMSDSLASENGLMSDGLDSTPIHMDMNSLLDSEVNALAAFSSQATDPT